MTIATAFWRALSVIFVIVLLSPLALVVIFAFSEKALSSFPITALSLRWWQAMIDFPTFWPAFTNSLIIGGAVGLLATVIGTLAALGLAAMPPRRAQAITALLALPLMLPPLFLGIVLLVWYLFLGIQLGLVTVVLSHLLFALPFVVIVVFARLASFDMRIIEAARDLGASPARAFFTVTLPVIQPVVVGAGLMAVALSIDDFILTSFTIGGGNTLPILVMSTLRTSVTPMTNAIGTLLIILSTASTLGALVLTRYRG
ncbi:MAG: ABC transporter permease [Devosia sp.]|uniref:ABC transporter permease n=1 Tax=Devosia sp. TaxID=1871048 RepID=UPI001A5EA179|nr:ABC transporter permease [Devosia sp.]MBL8598952.1 ABC transporter permease [Devosia sp.]